MRHLRQQPAEGCDGLIVALQQSFSTSSDVLDSLASVIHLTNWPLEPPISDLVRLVPVCMLVPLLAWPIAEAQSRTTNVPIYGFPHSTSPFGVQIRHRNCNASVSPQTNLRIGESSAFSTGDYFELPVRLRKGLLGVAPIFFIGALRDTRTKTWLVSYVFKYANSHSTILYFTDASCRRFGSCHILPLCSSTWCRLYSLFLLFFEVSGSTTLPYSGVGLNHHSKTLTSTCINQICGYKLSQSACASHLRNCEGHGIIGLSLTIRHTRMQQPFRHCLPCAGVDHP